MSFFRMGKHGERDCLIDPQGKPFFSLGIVHAAAYLEGEGREAFVQRFSGDWGKFAGKLATDFKEWGFNTAGYHSPLALLDHLPWMQDSYPARISYWMGRPSYPDVFDPAYPKAVEDLLEKTCAPVRDHPHLLGYYWTDTPRWDLGRARSQEQTDWVSAIRALPPTAPGKQVYADYVWHACQDLTELQVYTGRAAPVYEALLEAQLVDLPLEHPVILRHDRGFLRLIARRYYAVAAVATRKADPNHLIFGDRYLVGDHPAEVLEEALPHIDVLSIQPYANAFDREYFDLLHIQTGKPILICDHAINFPTGAHPQTVWPQCPNETEAAQAYTAYLRAVLACPYLVGYHRCQYIDRVVPGGTLLKQGFLQEDETPYQRLIDEVRRTNWEILAAYPSSGSKTRTG